MRVFAAALALFCASFAMSASAEFPPRVDYVGRDRIEYRLTPVIRDGVLEKVEVALEFSGDPSGETTIELPSEWGGETELWRGIEDLRGVSGVRVEETGDPTRRIVRGYTQDLPIRIRYDIIQDGEGPPTARGRGRYRPVVQPGYFHLLGHTALIVPQVDESRPVRVRVTGMPRGWRYASDLQHGGLRLGNVRASVMVGGDFRILNAPNGHARIAIRGEWGFSDQQFAREVGEIIGAQRDFWGDDRRPYLVTVLQQQQVASNMSVGGTGLSDAFAFFATPNAESILITRTLAHEGNHTWIPGEIGGLSPDETQERAAYWLSEGFTEFLTGRLLVRQGVWGPAEYAADINSMLDAYAQSPVSTAPNARIVADFWNDQQMQRLPYQRGQALALVWDARLRSQGHTLAAVMRDMRARARTQGETRDAANLFPASAQRFGLDVSADLATYVEQGAMVRLPEDAFGACGRVLTEEVPRFHRGFDIEATSANNNIIAGVDPSLNAYAAGVRDGMTLVRRDAGEIGNSNVEIVYVMRDGETERTFRYMPRGHGAFTRQRFQLAAPLEGETLAQCRALLTGD